MFRTVKNIFDKILETLVATAMAVLVLDVVWQVFTRFIIKKPSSWTEELATFLMIWVGLLGASVALNRGAHLGVDYVTVKLAPRNKLITELFVFAVIALFSLLVLVIGGADLVRMTLQRGQLSAALGIKMGYVYLALPISGFFLVLYSLEFFMERLTALIRHKQIESRITDSGINFD
jgi:TRAP-type C4-dicarboxylate transport system permease small subunit